MITKETAIEALTAAFQELPRGVGLYPADFKAAIMSAPEADAVHVIRCKDCRHGVDYYHDGDCYCSNPKWGLTYFGGSWEFYCADAKRRTDE